jgi:hypothetical protein
MHRQRPGADANAESGEVEIFSRKPSTRYCDAATQFLGSIILSGGGPAFGVKIKTFGTTILASKSRRFCEAARPA